MRGKRCRPRPSGSRRDSASLGGPGPTRPVLPRRALCDARSPSASIPRWDLARAGFSVNSRGRKPAGYLHIHKAAASPPSGDVGGDTCAVTYHGRDRGKPTDQRTFWAPPDPPPLRSPGVGLESRRGRGLPRLRRANTLGSAPRGPRHREVRTVASSCARDA